MKKKNIIVGKYMITVPEGASVVFSDGTSMELGFYHDGKIHYLDYKASASGELAVMKKFPDFCFPVGREKVESMWEYFSPLWMAISGMEIDEGKVSQEAPTRFEDIEDWEAFDEEISEKMKRLEAIDAEQRRKGEILYRYIAFPVADGNAIYQVTGLCGTMAKLHVCYGLGDDYIASELGEEAVIEIAAVRERLASKDAMTDIFEMHK